jgi:hypothetical protein
VATRILDNFRADSPDDGVYQLAAW